jgi:hypothetical protein
MPSWLRESTAAFLPLSVQTVIDAYIVGDENSTFYLTFWSVMHFAAGAFLAWVAPRATLTNGFVLHSSFELWEWAVGVTPSNARGLLDTFLDTVFFLSGFAVVRKLNPPRPN